jgi:hypothetical protein
MLDIQGHGNTSTGKHSHSLVVHERRGPIWISRTQRLQADRSCECRGRSKMGETGLDPGYKDNSR